MIIDAHTDVLLGLLALNVEPQSWELVLAVGSEPSVTPNGL
jgi:hypothetical protein